MAYVKIERIENYFIYQWLDGTRKWDGYSGYTTTLSLTLKVKSRSENILIVEILDPSVMKFRNGGILKNVRLEPFNGQKKFDFEWHVDLVNSSIVIGPPESQKMEIPILTQPPAQTEFKVNTYELNPDIRIRLIVCGAEDENNISGYLINKKVEVLDEV